jgi:two-component system, LytTR family, sensor kinase
LGFNEAQILPHRFADAKLAGALRIDARYRQALMWQRRSTQWLFIFGAWTLPGLYFAIQVYLQHAYEARPITLTQALLRGIVFWLLWVVSSPLILWLARTFPIPRREWLDGLLFHAPAGFIFSFAHLLLYVAISSRLSRGVWPDSVSAMLAEFQPVFLSSFAWWSLIYWTILLASYAFDYYHRYQAGQLRASKLETELAQSQLAALKMQLHPHFLFNTLHSISALMREDVEAADQMIARLGEFLRMTLRNSGEQETTLEQELNFLECYLEIERLRFQDRLTTRIEAEPDAMDARVPNLFLQPIVENAIRHGVTRQMNEGVVAISARRDNGRLRVEVRDNGPGLTAKNGVADGVGLANTRSRLRRLYGDDHNFGMTNAAEGGLVVSLEIPYREWERL